MRVRLFRDKAIWWFLSVCVFAGIPIAFNFMAAVCNSDPAQPRDFSRVLAGDAYLYAFILSFAAVADFLGDETPNRKNVAGGFVLIAFMAGFFYFMISVNSIATHPLIAGTLQIASAFVLVGVFSVYTFCKLSALNGVAAEDLEGPTPQS